MIKHTCIFLFSLASCFAASSQQTIPMVKIPAGSFWMGSEGDRENYDEKPIHKVHITHSFLIGKTEITNAQYEQFDPEHVKFRGKNGFSYEDDEAVVFVTYHDALEYCKWLSKKEGKTYRLPTEAEWEYACRAGSDSLFSMGNILPDIYLKNQAASRNPSPVSLKVAQSPENKFGLYDMHGNVEEWCLDWYAPYTTHEVCDPTGSDNGIYRVTRGGSHNTPTQFLRSANRMAMLPDDKHWLTGFRVVQAEYPKKQPTKEAETIPNYIKVDQKKHAWAKPSNLPYFKEPMAYIHTPDSNSNTPFYKHNHCPAITWCNNGDLLAIWFSADAESGREMVILESRLQPDSNSWNKASLFFKVPDRNMTGSSLINLNGTLMHANGVEASGDWQNLIMVQRTSQDNGATWTTPKIIAPEHKVRHQVIAGPIRTKEGWIIQPADASPESNGGTAIHISKDGGNTWFDPGAGKTSKFEEGETGGTIAGIHAGIIQLNDGRLMALGRGDAIRNKNGLLRMPLSISDNMGESWTYSASEFPPIDGGQRLSLIRLNEGAILLVSFTHHSERIKDNIEGMQFTQKNGNYYTGNGMYAAISWDEGKTWKKKLVTDGKTRSLDGGAWTSKFTMDSTHAEPKGYLSICQTPDNEIHLISSKIHYRFNLAWLME